MGKRNKNYIQWYYPDSVSEAETTLTQCHQYDGCSLEATQSTAMDVILMLKIIVLLPVVSLLLICYLKTRIVHMNKH